MRAGRGILVGKSAVCDFLHLACAGSHDSLEPANWTRVLASHRRTEHAGNAWEETTSGVRRGGEGALTGWRASCKRWLSETGLAVLQASTAGSDDRGWAKASIHLLSSIVDSGIQTLRC